MAESLLFHDNRKRAILIGCDKIHRTKPCKSRACKKAEAYTWSSANARIKGFRDDILSGDWLDEKEREEYKDFMAEDDKEVDTLIRKATSTGRLLGGTERFVKKLEKAFDRCLLPKKAGRPRKKNRV